MMILVRSSSGSSSIKHTAVAIKENGWNSTSTGFGIWMATRVEVGGDEGWSWQGGLKLKRDGVGDENWSWRSERGDELDGWRLKMAPRPCCNKTINGNWKGTAVWLLSLTSGPDIIALPLLLPP
jgi:hypothetical protein